MALESFAPQRKVLTYFDKALRFAQRESNFKNNDFTKSPHDRSFKEIAAGLHGGGNAIDLPIDDERLLSDVGSVDLDLTKDTSEQPGVVEALGLGKFLELLDANSYKALVEKRVDLTNVSDYKVFRFTPPTSVLDC